MSYRFRNFVPALLAALALLLSAPLALTQKPPAPSPPPSPSPPPGGPSAPTRSLSDPLNGLPNQPNSDLIMFLMGRVTTGDGTKLPHDVVVERICNATVRQQIYASPNGAFSMELGSRVQSLIDASGDPNTDYKPTARQTGQVTGIPRTELENCELRASLAGFRSNTVALMALDSFSGTANVGDIIVERMEKVDSLTLSATPYRAPKEARKAYERGLDAEKSGNLSAAQQSFEKAVKIYPQYANAWFRLGSVLQRENQKVAARAAYTTASKIDIKFLPPFLALSSLAYHQRDWNELLDLTSHILELDPLNYGRIKGYILDLDAFDYAEAYFYHAVANFNLNHVAEAEKSALKAANLDVRPRFPQIHLLLAEIFTSKNDAPRAISELQIYLDQVPNAKNADEVRARLLSLQAATANPVAP